MVFMATAFLKVPVTLLVDLVPLEHMILKPLNSTGKGSTRFMCCKVLPISAGVLGAVALIPHWGCYWRLFNR